MARPKKPDTREPRYATYPEAGEYCRRSERTIRRYVQQGALKSSKRLGRPVVNLNDIDDLLGLAKYDPAA